MKSAWDDSPVTLDSAIISGENFSGVVDFEKGCDLIIELMARKEFAIAKIKRQPFFAIQQYEAKAGDYR